MRAGGAEMRGVRAPWEVCAPLTALASENRAAWPWPDSAVSAVRRGTPSLAFAPNATLWGRVGRPATANAPGRAPPRLCPTPPSPPRTPSDGGPHAALPRRRPAASTQ
eukprot:347701-Chlamydomonas_euryale.AAC.16